MTPPTAAESVRKGQQLLPVRPHRFILLEDPFGRLRPETAGLIDFVVCIDLPLHLTLARRLRRQIETVRGYALRSPEPERRAEVLDGGSAFFETYLDGYLDWGHHFFAELLRQLVEASDLVVDGCRPVDELAGQVVAAVRDVAETG